MLPPSEDASASSLLLLLSRVLGSGATQKPSLVPLTASRSLRRLYILPVVLLSPASRLPEAFLPLCHLPAMFTPQSPYSPFINRSYHDPFEAVKFFAELGFPRDKIMLLHQLGSDCVGKLLEAERKHRAPVQQHLGALEGYPEENLRELVDQAFSSESCPVQRDESHWKLTHVQTR